MYLKNFDNWNEEKKFLHSGEALKIYLKVRYIWYVKLGVNVGAESDGKKEFRQLRKKMKGMYFPSF